MKLRGSVSGTGLLFQLEHAKPHTVVLYSVTAIGRVPMYDLRVDNLPAKLPDG